MIEELTPQLLFLGFLLVIVLSSVFTLIASLLVLWRYRRGVLRAMAETAGAADSAPTVAAETPAAQPALPQAAAATAERYRLAITAPWEAVGRDAAAGAVFALVMNAAVSLAFPALRDPVVVALYAWGYAWPMVLALVLIGPGGVHAALVAVVVYFSPLLLLTLFAVASEGSSLTSGADVYSARNMITPLSVVKAWLTANAVPTLMLILFLGRRLRAVGPLLLGLTTMATTGLIVAVLTLLTREAAALLDRAGLALPWLLLGTLLVSVAVFGLAGWWLLRAIGRAWRRKAINDRSIRLDALWLFFAAIYAMYYAPAGLAWATTPVLAFAVYKAAKTALRMALPPRTPAGGRGLTFLRVFSLGQRSDRLFDVLTRHWRHVGAIQLITGPDVAHSTVQPHQLLDFLAGRLATHFIGDLDSLEQRMRERDQAPDREGLFRINNFFCHSDTWQAVLARLVSEGDVVLMDLRSFSERNAGCVHELRYLANFVPLQRCVLLTDDSTDQAFVLSTLRDAWLSLDPASPNRHSGPEAVRLDRLEPGSAGLRRLLLRLCEAV